MSSYLNSLLSRSFKQTEVIRPRLPSIFEPVTGSGIPVSGQQYIIPGREENQTKSFVDREFISGEFLNGPEKGTDHSTGFSRLPGPFELSETQKKLKYSDLRGFQSDTQDPLSGSRPAQKETDPAGSMRIKSIKQEKKRLDFPESDVSLSDQAFSEKFTPLFKPSVSNRENRRENEPLNTEIMGDSLQSAYRQVFNGNTRKEYENKPYAGQPGRFGSIQPAFRRGSGEINPALEKSNFTSASRLIVPKLSEDSAAIKKLEKIASSMADLGEEVKAKAEIELEKPVIRVNIGRIEVKAVMQASQPGREKKPQAPKLSLNDSLNSRNRGKA